MMARMCEPRLGILIQGRIRISGCRPRIAQLPCPSDEVVARGELPRAVEKPSMASGQPFGRGRRSASGAPTRVLYPNSGSGRRTRSRACSPGCRARRGQVERNDLVDVGAGNSGASVSGPKTIGGAGSAVPAAPAGRSGRPWRMAQHGEVPLAIDVLEAAVGLEPADLRRQNSFDSIWRFNGGGPAISDAHAAPFPRR